MREIWKDINGFEGLYQVSNLGRVRNKRIYLSQKTNNKGYKLVDLYKENKRKQLLVHRLVAIAFVPNPQNHNIVNHIDENPQNNHAYNLEWCTQKYNMNYGSVPQKIGEANSKAVKQIEKTGELVKVFPSAIQAQRETGISNGNINDCLHNRRKTAGGYLWQYAK